ARGRDPGARAAAPRAASVDAGDAEARLPLTLRHDPPAAARSTTTGPRRLHRPRRLLGHARLEEDDPTTDRVDLRHTAERQHRLRAGVAEIEVRDDGHVPTAELGEDPQRLLLEAPMLLGRVP